MQAKFLAEAKARLAQMNPYVIGVTGSYGKTSTKLILGQLLQHAIGPTFCPPGSVNTLMGITRHIREKLRPEQRHAVIEMAAYHRGSIARLCELTPPRAAVITNVGLMHLERFGSEGNVYLAKSELAQAVPSDGILVCNGDNPGSRRMAAEFRKQTTLLYGLDPSLGPLDALAADIAYDEAGTRFTVHWQGQAYAVRTAMVGRHAVSNILGAFTMACALGADPAFVASAIALLSQIENRLELKAGASGVTWLMDGYNSNPAGFADALDVLSHLGQRRILVTPGMVELGEKQAPENRAAAQRASSAADMIYVVGKTNREAWLAGLREAGVSEERCVLTDTMEQALAEVRGKTQAGDAVLIENDLPDLYEAEVRF